jgi:glycosyltransferase involved in cell wall biosynthesis
VFETVFLKKMKTVSVIIPAYNVEASIKKCLDSVIFQTFKDIEIIIINDGSSDKTAEIAKSYGKRIKYLTQGNRGQGAARNRGLDIAKGEFIAFLDADDYWLPKFLDTTVTFLQKHKEAIAVSCGSYTRLHNGDIRIGPPFIANGNVEGQSIVLDEFFKFWSEQDHVRTGTALIRHKVIKQAGVQRDDLRVSQDLEYWGYIATYGKWGFIPRPFWVGNSRSHARGIEWLRKYNKRRYLCPTVESWQKRILPRLKKEQLQYFYKVRGRVASGYAQNKIIIGNRKEALDIVKKYGEDIPANRMTWIMRQGAKTGALGWFNACLIIRLHEYIKAMRTSIF